MAKETLSTSRLLAWISDGSHVAVPLFGHLSYGWENAAPVVHAPRVTNDPYPWERWGMRYRSSELALVKIEETEGAS